MTVAGTYGIKPPLPAIGGTEALGMVEELGAGVENLQVGQCVIGGWQGRPFPGRCEARTPRARWH